MELFQGEAAFAANRRQILDTSKQSSCKNCEKWCRSDPECDVMTYDSNSRLCTKLRATRRHGNVFSVITDPVFGPNGQIESRPLSLITHNSEFALSNEHHHIKFIEQHESAVKCRQRAAQFPGTRFVSYDPKCKECVGVSKSDLLPNLTMGVRRGKMISSQKEKAQFSTYPSHPMPIHEVCSTIPHTIPTMATCVPVNAAMPGPQMAPWTHHIASWASSMPSGPSPPCMNCGGGVATAGGGGGGGGGDQNQNGKSVWLFLILLFGLILLLALLWKVWKMLAASSDETTQEIQEIEQKQEVQQSELDRLLQETPTIITTVPSTPESRFRTPSSSSPFEAPAQAATMTLPPIRGFWDNPRVDPATQYPHEF